MSSRETTSYQNITIEHVDYAMHDWLKYDVVPTAKGPNDEYKPVEIIVAAGERWAMMDDKRALRDSNGVLILPLISIRRVNMDRDRTKLSLGVESNRMTIARRIDKKTNIVQNAISSRELPNRQRNGRAVYEVTTIPFPDWFVTYYEVSIWTQFVSQMNEIIEKIVDSLDIQNSFVMQVRDSMFTRDPRDDRPFDDRKKLKGFYFVGFLENDLSDAGNFEEFTDTERIVKYTFNIKVPTYLQLDPRGELPAVQTETTAFEVKFVENVKFVDDPEELELYFTQKIGT